MDGQEAAVQDWKETIPQEYKGEACLQNIPDFGSLVKSYVHSQKRLGSAINIPGQNATDEEKSEFLKKLGRPESPDKYTLPDFSKLPEGLKPNENFVKALATAAYSRGLNNDQHMGILQEILKFEVDAAKQSEVEEQNDMKQRTEALRKEFGSAYDQRVGLAKKTFETFAASGEREEFDKRYGNDPLIIRMFSRMGERLLEDRSIDGTGGRGSLTLTPEEARMEIAKIRADANHPYNNRKFDGTKERTEAVEHMNRLYEYTYAK
jgi:hypothetical protein